MRGHPTGRNTGHNSYIGSDRAPVKAASGIFSYIKRTDSPVAIAAASPSRMTVRPRTTVATGQPVASTPSNCVQPHFDAMSSLRSVRFAFRSTIVKSAHQTPSSATYFPDGLAICFQIDCEGLTGQNSGETRPIGL